MEKGRMAEDMGMRGNRPLDPVGRCVRHFVFGEGTVIGLLDDSNGLLIQFDCIPVPRILRHTAKLEYLS